MTATEAEAPAVPVHDAAWHLREAERLLEEADAVDKERERTDWRRWSFSERSQAHSALATAISACGGPVNSAADREAARMLRAKMEQFRD